MTDEKQGCTASGIKNIIQRSAMITKKLLRFFNTCYQVVFPLNKLATRLFWRVCHVYVSFIKHLSIEAQTFGNFSVIIA